MTPTRARRTHTSRELSDKFGRSPRTIRRIISEPRDDYLARTQERADRIRKLRESGMTMRAIAAELGCSVGTVHYALKSR